MAKIYKPADRMRDLIAGNEILLMALTRFGIPLGFGDSAIEDVCKRAGVDTSTFLAVANFFTSGSASAHDDMVPGVNLRSLMAYLGQAHTYFLDFQLPAIRRKLIEAISGAASGDVVFLILKFFDDYVEEVRRHMEYENSQVFTYVGRLLAGERDPSFSIATFLSNHRPIASKLRELKEIFICHYAGPNTRNDLINSALFDIMTCERDLMTHCGVEDHIFVPAVMHLESSLESAVEETDVVTPDSVAASADPLAELTDRERDIIRCVARGMANKEIAAHLNVSVHTVATHRRNISAKLEIHSTAALTIFAIIHHLIDLTEVNIADN